MAIIGIQLFAGVEELDAIGPWQVLSCWTRRWPADGWTTITFSRVPGEVVAANGLRMRADYEGATLPSLDVVVHPGGPGIGDQLNDPGQLEWVHQQAPVGTLRASVRTGSLVFAAAGILAGRQATTYWDSLDTLAWLDPSIGCLGRDRHGAAAGAPFGWHRPGPAGQTGDPVRPCTACLIPLRPRVRTTAVASRRGRRRHVLPGSADV